MIERILITLFLCIAFPWSLRGAEEAFDVSRITPGNKTRDVEVDPLIQIHVSSKFDPKSVTAESFSLKQRGGEAVDFHVSGDLGGVVTLSVLSPLKLATEYELSVLPTLRSRSGESIQPLTVRFQTTDVPPKPPRTDIDRFRFNQYRLVTRDGVCGLAITGNALFFCTWDGSLIRLEIDGDGTLVGEPVVLLQRKRRFNAIVVDPRSDAETTTLWLSHDSQHQLSLGPNDFSGTVSKVTLVGENVQVDDVVTGLPTGDHPASGLVFGPDGRLYVSQGALSMLGGKPEQPETPLSAATLAIDLQHELWHGAPVNVQYFRPDTNPEAIEVFATGIREAFDLCWHSNGNLYAGVNMNDTRDETPTRDGLPAVNVRPAEMMLRIVKGKYYGHPNPTRDEWVLLGGNPTSDIDPWEVAELPVGTQPEPHFDPRLLIRDLEKDKGPSADGVCEWTAEGTLRGRLMFCFYTATRGIHTYQLSEDGGAVSDHQPLVTADNRLLRFGAPLDIVQDSRGWLYVADFSAPERGDSGRGGGVWLVKPTSRQRVVVSDDQEPDSLPNIAGDSGAL